MKLYNPQPDEILRIVISRQGDDTQYTTICEATQQEVYDYLRSLILKQNISIFEKGKVTSVNIREAIGSKNGRSISFSFKGLSPKQVLEIIESDLKEK